MKYKTTQGDFEVFEAAAQQFIHKFGLRDWEVYISLGALDEETASGNFTGGPATSRCCRITLSEEFPSGPTTEQLWKIAFHEVCHMLLEDLWQLVGTYGMRHAPGFADQWVDKEHAVIRRLESSVFKKLAYE